MTSQEKIIEAQRKVIARMRAYHELALKEATELEKVMPEGVHPPVNSDDVSEVEKAESFAAAMRRRKIPLQ